MDDSRTIDGTAVTERRVALGWSRAKLSRESSVSLSYIKLIEAGPPQGARWPRERVVQALAAALQCDIDSLRPFAQRRTKRQPRRRPERHAA